jgi:hypothetical protein
MVVEQVARWFEVVDVVDDTVMEITTNQIMLSRLLSATVMVQLPCHHRHRGSNITGFYSTFYETYGQNVSGVWNSYSLTQPTNRKASLLEAL